MRPASFSNLLVSESWTSILCYTLLMRYRRLSVQKRCRIVQCFIEDVPAATTARLVFVNRKTVNAWYSELRSRLLLECHNLPEIDHIGAFKGYHERRIAKFNGLSRQSKRIFLIESRIRHQFKRAFVGLVQRVTTDLLD